MAKKQKTVVVVDKKGKEKKEYPKSIRVGESKVIVQNAEEEAALNVEAEKPAESKSTNTKKW